MSAKKRSCVVSVRLCEADAKYVRAIAKARGIKPSHVIMMLINYHRDNAPKTTAKPIDVWD